MRALTGDGTFATVTGWVVGLVVALVFAGLAYLFYYAAIAIFAGTVGYTLGAAAWGIIGNEQGVIAFVIGLVVGRRPRGRCARAQRAAATSSSC